MKVKKIKNKNELSPKPKKPPEKKIVVRFSFTGIDGKKYGIPNARLKINENGGTSCLTKDEEGKWKAIKGKLTTIKISYESRRISGEDKKR